ncbi:unnamed protein product [Leptosia nina]|uniref:Mitochondrial processing peptidase beta subunit n=1 Tax=Leptosia nina TaxID=320188 RepID=A0AAV1JXI8_9NEOP
MKTLRNILIANNSFRYHKRYVSKNTNIIKSELPNGLQVATEETSSPLACVSLFARVGPRFENHDTNGISHFIEHMAYRGFCTMNRDAIDKYLNDIGAKMSAATEREFQVFNALCPSDRASDVVAILAKIVTELELSDQEMDCERQNVVQEMVDLDRNPKAVMFDYLHKAAFQGTTLAQSVVGPSRNVKRFNRDCAFFYMKNNYHPLRLLLATSGGVSHSSISQAACQYFGNMVCEGDEAAFGPRRFTSGRVLYRDDSMPFAHVAYAVEAPGMKSFDYYPLLVAKNLVGAWDKSQGGKDRHAAYLAQAAASANLCEKFESFYIAYSDVGLWGVYFVAPKMAIEDMIYNIQSVWMSLCNTMCRGDIDRAICATKLELAKRVDGAINSSYDIGAQFMLKNERTQLSSMYEELSHLNAKSVMDVADSYIYNRPLVIAGVGPTEAIPDFNRSQAGQYWLRL